MSWLGRLQQLFVPSCDRCGGPTVVDRETLLSTIPAVFEVVTWCPRCAQTASRRQVVDCLQEADDPSRAGVQITRRHLFSMR